MKSFSLLLLTLSVLLIGCEGQLDAETERSLSLQTKRATEVLPSDASYVGMVDLQRVKQNRALDPFGSGSFSPEGMSGEAGARFRDFLEATGFDPEQDLREVYVALTPHGTDADAAPSLVVYADYDRDRLASYVAEQFGQNFERTEYRGVPFYRIAATERGGEAAFALVNDQMIVASPDEAHVRAMLDRISGGGNALSGNAEMMTLVQEAGGGDVWFVARALSAHVSGDAEQSPSEMEAFGRAVEDLAVSLRTSDSEVSGRVLLTPRPGVSTGDLASLTRGLVAAMKTADTDPSKREALEEVQVRESGGKVRVTFEVEEALLTSLQK